jgi:hypothetical protein
VKSVGGTKNSLISVANNDKMPSRGRKNFLPFSLLQSEDDLVAKWRLALNGDETYKIEPLR